VELVPGQEGLVHVSELSHKYIKNPHDVVEVGDIIPVKVIKIDELGRINLSHKEIAPETEQKTERRTFKENRPYNKTRNPKYKR